MYLRRLILSTRDQDCDWGVHSGGAISSAAGPKPKGVLSESSTNDDLLSSHTNYRNVSPCVDQLGVPMNGPLDAPESILTKICFIIVQNE